MTRDDLYGYYRRYYVPNNATLVIVGDVDTDEALRRVEHHFGGIRAGRASAARPHRRTGTDRRAPRDDSQGGTTAYLKVGVSRAGRHRPALLPAARARRGADRRQGTESVVQFSGAAAAAQRAAVPCARRARPGVVGVRRAAADRAAVPVHHFGHGDRRHRRSRVGVGAARGARSRARATASPTRSSSKAKAQLKARLVFDNDSVTNIAHQLGYFETIASVDVFAAIPAPHRRGHARRRSPPWRARVLRPRRTAPSAGSIRNRCPDPRTPADVTFAPGFARPRAVRTVLDNGAVVLAKETRTTPAVDHQPGDARRVDLRSAAMRRARRICCRASIDRGTDDRGRAATTSPKSSTAAASRSTISVDAASVLAGLHVSGGGFRRGLGAARRHRAWRRRFRRTSSRRAKARSSPPSVRTRTTPPCAPSRR